MKTPPSFHYSTLFRKSQEFMTKIVPFAVALMFLASSFTQHSASAVEINQKPNLVAQTYSSSLRTTTPSYQYNKNSFMFTDYEVDYYLSKAADGTSRLKVREEFVAEFPTTNVNHGFDRMIPFTNQDTKNLTTKSDHKLDIKVTRNGVAEPTQVKVDEGENAFIVRIGDADTYVHGEQTYVLEYEFQNVITDFGDYQELYWDTNGTGSQQRFGRAVARVHFEEGVADLYDNQSWCYVGRYGEQGDERCQISQLEDGVEFTTTRLLAGENMTIDVQFKPASFTIPAPAENYLNLLLLAIELIWAGVVAWLFLRARAKVETKYRFYKDYFIKPEYTAPRDVTVAEANMNYPINLAGKAHVATLLEMAVNHKIEIIDATPEGKKSKQWRVRVKTLDLAPDQRKVLELLAGSRRIEDGQEIKIKRRSNTSLLTKLNRELDQGLRDSLEAKGYSEPKAQSKTTPSDIATIVAMMGGIGFFVLNMMLVQEFGHKSYRPLFGGNIPTIIGCIVALIGFFSAFAGLVWIKKIENHTRKGLELIRYLDGLKLYIKMAEAERLQVLQSVDGVDTSHQGIAKLYEKLLPYAVIFGQEKSWLKELGKYYEYSDVSRPDWYLGVGTFTALSFMDDLRNVSTVSARSFYGATGSSSSGFSGGGGGGFSGGGGGGGGTSGW